VKAGIATTPSKTVAFAMKGFHPGGMRVETGLAPKVSSDTTAGQQHSDGYNDATQSGQRDARGP
jgi:hypothetical protein